MNIQRWFLLGLTGLIFLLWREESSAAPQFKSISSLVLSLFYDPTLTSVGEYWKNYSFDCPDLCWQSDVSAFLSAVYVCHSFPHKEKVLFNFVAAITVHSDFGSQENKVCHCFHIFPIYLPWNDGTRFHDLSFQMLSFKPAFNLIFAVCNFMCSETLYFAFKCDSKIPGGI